MTPLPKRKTSRARKGNRRSHHALRPAHLVECRNCRAMRLAHTVCPNCGHYRGQEVIQAEATS